ncbi:MAG TPA: helix-turn-helix transcriptional regulator [Sumerlaeia bacterium]|nr:helix-turn-helix transcriptional regulator [Sumerlaeia bacterium]
MADETIGSLIAKSRRDTGLTQDQFGRKYNVSGPAIFKFEKGYVKPSLSLWLQMAKDVNLSEQKAVLMWVREKLPKKFQDFISLEPPMMAKETGAVYGKGKGRARAKAPATADPEAVRKEILADRSAPKGLKRLLKDGDFWDLYRPQGDELLILRNVFGQLGDGSRSSYGEALRLVREFGKN